MGNIGQDIQKSQIVLQAKSTNAANIASIIPCVGMTAEEVEANAARIVTCVNACAGISDPGQWVPMAKSHIEISDLQGKQNQRLKSKIRNLTSLLEQAVQQLLASNVWAGSSSLVMANDHLIEQIQSFIGQPENEQPPQQ
ncbi:MAG: hypothetical protein AB7C90_04355 [Bacteroidales bacterium]